MKTLIFFALIIYSRECLCGIKSEGWHDDAYVDAGPGQFNEMTNSTLRNVVKKYHCAAEDIEDEKTILYGTKAWTFPEQTVNLTLRYPSTRPDKSPEEGEYLVTGILVILYMDGPDSRGFVTDGGLFMERISLTFVIKGISRLSYQFWLYGVTKPAHNLSEYSWKNTFC